MSKNITVRVATYNVLSSYYGQPDHHESSLTSWDNRFDLLTKTIISEIEKKSVIALQEVDRDWSGKFLKFFSEHEYTFWTMNYSTPSSGHMGIAIAFPSKEYTIVEAMTYFPPVDIKEPKEENNSLASTLICKLMSFFTKKTQSSSEIAKSRKNLLQLVILENKDNQRFGFSTYHSPCLFGNDRACTAKLILHSYITNWLNNVCENIPYILAGDFNTAPHEEALLPCLGITNVKWAQGTLDALKGALLPSGPTLTSVYGARTEGEPDFTTCSQKKSSNPNSTPFKACLDYIFAKGFVEAREYVLVGTESGSECVLPSDTHPSDHQLLAATVTLSY